MIGLTVNWLGFSFRPFKAKTKPPVCLETRQDRERQDLRRSYVTEMMCSGACAGELGAQALMAVFPRDF